MTLGSTWGTSAGWVPSATGTNEEVEVFRAAGALDEDPVRWADDVLVVERIKELLLA